VNTEAALPTLRGSSLRLNWKLWDQLLTDEIARLMKCTSRTVEET
jgi:hypothetical protein